MHAFTFFLFSQFIIVQLSKIAHDTPDKGGVSRPTLHLPDFLTFCQELGMLVAMKGPDNLY